MLWIKLLGGILILGAGAFAAGFTVCYEKRKLRVIEAWIDLILYIRGQIDCYLTPLDEILCGADRELLEECMPAHPHPNPTLSSLYKSSYNYLGGEANRLITAFIREIGSSYREDQVRRCDYYLTALGNLREKTAAGLPSRIRLCVSLCLCSALAMAILLW